MFWTLLQVAAFCSWQTLTAVVLLFHHQSPTCACKSQTHLRVSASPCQKPTACHAVSQPAALPGFAGDALPSQHGGVGWLWLERWCLNVVGRKEAKAEMLHSGLRELGAKKASLHPTWVGRAVKDQAPQTIKELWAEPPQPHSGFPASMDGAGMPLDWWGPVSPPVTDSSCGVAAAHRHTDRSRSEYSHPQHNPPPLHPLSHLHVRMQRWAFSQPNHPFPFTAQIWDLQCILVYHLLLSDAELSLLWKLWFGGCMQACSHDNWA